MKEQNCCHKSRRTPWEEAERKKLINRLSRIEGQIKGVKAMLEEDRFCGDIVIQVLAAEKGLRNFGLELAKSHFHSCVTPAITEGDESASNDFMELFERLLR